MKNLTLTLLDEEYRCDSITKQNMDTYLSAKEQADFISTMLIEPFESSLKESIDFNKENLPDQKEVVSKRVGKYGFTLEVVPTNKPAYAPVFNQMKAYLKGLQFGSEKRKNRYGVRTIDDEAYASLPDTIEVFTMFYYDSMQPAVDVKIKSKATKKNLTERIEALEIDVDNDYSELNEENASRYVTSKDLVERINKQIVKPFQDAVKNNIGFSKANMPKGVVYSKDIVGDVLVYATNSTADNIKYAPIVNGMIEYLESMNSLVAPGARSDVPDIRKFNDINYLKISSMKKKFEALKKQSTEDSLRQTVSYLKLPKNQLVVIE